jgi:hypothetical protein
MSKFVEFIKLFFTFLFTLMAIPLYAIGVFVLVEQVTELFTNVDHAYSWAFIATIILTAALCLAISSFQDDHD